MGRSDSASTSLAPGFRFHPTDEELVSYYLKRKVCGKPFRFDAISEIDIYKVEPWDLPGLSKLKTRDLEWYFFSGLDRKYGNGSRTNRATSEGYWKTTGKDRPVHHRSRVVGMKKTLVYHLGRAPRGKRSNWVMHEYKLVDEELEKAGFFLDGFVMCRIFRKSGSGPKNGEQYGAPFVEEEWEDDNLEAMVPGDMSPEEPCVDDDAFIEQNDLDQDLDLRHSDVPFLIDVYTEDSNNCVEDSRDITGSEQKSLAGEGEYEYGLQVLDDQTFFGLSAHVGGADVVKNEYIAQPTDVVNEASTNCLPNELFLDSDGKAPVEDGLFLDAIDFLEPAEENPLDFGIPEEYLDDDISAYLHFDSPPELMATDADKELSTQENLDDAAWQIPSASQQLSTACGEDIASSSKQVMEVPKSKPSKPDIQYPFLNQASRLLGNIPAPPAFASEFPTKDVAARLSASAHSSSPVHVTAGMIRITNITVGGGGLQWSFDKSCNVNVLLSLDIPQGVGAGGLESMSGMLSSKMGAVVSRYWSCFMLFWVFVFAVSIKIGTCIYAK